MIETIGSFITKWHKEMPAATYSIILAIIITIALWIDTNLKLGFYKNLLTDPFDWSIEQKFFLVANVLVSLPFVFLIIYRICVAWRVWQYRKKYPYANINKVFYLIHFGGKVHLIDRYAKEVLWIKTWQTAVDLDFIYEWVDLKVFTLYCGVRPVNYEEFWNKTGFKFKVADGTEFNSVDLKRGRPIYTQDTPEQI